VKKLSPPHNETAERNVLGALIIDPEAYSQVASILNASDFYIVRNRTIYEAIVTAARQGGVDYVTVANVLEAAGRLSQVGGSAYLTELVTETVSSVYAERHARIVRDYATRRGLLQVASDVAKLAWKLDEDIDTVQAQAQTALLQAKREMGIPHRVSASQMASEVYDVIEQWQTKPLLPGQTRGLATGIRALDNALGGLESGVYIVAGRPSMGKTALLLQMVEGIAGTGHRCLLL